jgi:uncharacterized protein (TIGR02246 family)
MSLPLEEWAERYARAWEAADAEAAAALFTEDATYRADPFGDPYQGREGVRRYWRQVAATQANVEVAIGRTMAVGSRAVVEWWTQMDADGTPVTLPGALLLDRPYPGSTTVTTVNGGVTGLVRTLVIELAPTRVNALHPAIVGDSPQWVDMPDERRDALVQRTPIGRLVTMAEVVDAARFLLENRAMNGINLPVDGGWLCM